MASDPVKPMESMDRKNSDVIQKPSEIPQKFTDRKEWKQLQVIAQKIVEYPAVSSMMTLFTLWTLYQSDILSAGTDKGAVDTGFMAITTIAFFCFLTEMILVSIYDENYLIIPAWSSLPGETQFQTWFRRSQIGSFYFWLDFLATATIILDLQWLLGTSAYNTVSGVSMNTDDGGGGGSNAGQTGVQATRVLRIVRMVRLIRIAKLYKYAYGIVFSDEKAKQEAEKSESRVGAAMSDLTNRRVIVLILLMLIIIPLLTVSESDTSLQLGSQLLHQLAVLTVQNPALYETGLNFAIETVKEELPLVAVSFNGVYAYINKDRFEFLRDSEMQQFLLTSEGVATFVAYDQKDESIAAALYSIYTTTFIIFLLLLGIYFFANDVNQLVIGPIEKLVELVRKISVNPLGVDYKVTLGEKDGFVDGMETTVLLITINKIGALMRVGFGEAGASIIAKNLSEASGGKLNLLGAGTMINSIFGFCDVRQFTDTTECLQEEVMLFVNRIAHILHSIVVQCSGAANKNIGDAFLLTWKLDEKYSSEEIATLADQALLTFCKALIELARYQDFICNFSVAATARLFKRFPDYNVRIGCGLHVGWAIEGAIGSNRKIDASYLSPHVSTTEYLESSTKQYGVSLLLSEPFYKLLSAETSQYIRQVDRVRRAAGEEPMGLYTYDTDITINWNDPYRNTIKMDNKTRLQKATQKASVLPTGGSHNGEGPNPQLGTIHENSGHFSTSSASAGNNSHSNNSHSVAGNMQRKKSTSAVPTLKQLKAHKNNQSVVAAGRRRPSMKPPLMHIAFESLQEGDEDEEGDQAAADEEAARDAENKRLMKARETPNIVLAPYTQQVWKEDDDIVELRHRVDDSFRALWALGMEAYIKGNWATAKDVFEQTLKQSNKKDGPSKFLLEVMGETNFIPPEDWHGYRDEAGGGH